jgi:hypothetical protein
MVIGMSAEPHRAGVDVVKVLTGDHDEGAVIEHRIEATGHATGGTSTCTDTPLAVALGTARKLFTTQIPEPARVATLTEMTKISWSRAFRRCGPEAHYTRFCCGMTQFL